ncbi:MULTISPECIES: ATP-dependent Clp protease ATP-binding subunit ClpA [Clostridium]|uniref:ATP-dependent Clp protease ATP-binding subunit ClpA n=2 Tax=Clostridium TaxID=1485 RepID=A0A151AMS2_9CLOT|nr:MULTISPECIES: ATP-dependent Clp protease ATP-binding subunit ClpA [Clostridium]KYH28945.1 ATP-dependent Clp protease ATP-binding subunit ClpA [Clostridium colicanis DSM 13634]MBE6044857.1 ATP-dependent Clp protease ATP-binding subunit ClpA [Clostridium thermopalmarium]PRR73211.1 ATP-dependent Clp protease ATP-binding subunit ClpA [Clostridium thermopalmarium DSM 5974]PVZ25224.1 ATP-dependent Clp protease ATP-binding subunit ClpA [Clostridium thermopalmarium DSM 5974]
MNLDNLLKEIFIAAYSEAKISRHEYLTPEHILYAALQFEEARKIIIDSGGNINELKEDLLKFFRDEIPLIDYGEPIQTLGVQNIISSAGAHVVSADKETIGFQDVLVALYDSEDTFASYFLRKQGIRRLDILKNISHNIFAQNNAYEELALDSEEDEEEFYETANRRDILNLYTLELTEKARRGEIDPVIGREDILKRTIQVLCRRLKNNPIHVGEAGVGKTAITEGLAQMIADDKVPDVLKGSKIYSLDIAALLAGAKYRGDFEERIKRVLNRIREKEKAIVYIDEIHSIVGTGAASGGSMDAANILKPFLTDGKLRVIGSTTYDEYKKYFEKDRALSRRFQKIEVLEPTREDTYKILLGLKNTYEKYHGVIYTDDALKSAVELTSKYLHERHLPDKAIDVIDEAGAYARLKPNNKEGDIKITEKDIQKVISVMAKIPEKNVSLSEVERLKNLSKELKKFIFGQDKAIETVVGAIKRSRAGFNDEEKPVASLLFVGQTGVGKTEIAKKLAEILDIPLIRFDMSEYQEKHTVARLIGAPPGYVGYEEGGLLTGAIRKTPYCVLLLDEIEKAHPDIFNVLLQVMDYATLTDNDGKRADFRNVILIMTSNAGARFVGKEMLGFGSRVLKEDSIAKEVERIFSPEFRNRLDEIIIFNKMDENMAYLIAKKSLKEFDEKLSAKNINLNVTEKCYRWIAERGVSSIYGAREILRIVQQEIKPYFVDEVLFGSLSNGGEVKVDVVNGKLIINKYRG